MILKGKDGTLYRCSLKSGITGTTGAASCKKKVGNKWEPIGEQQAESDDDGLWFHFTTGTAKSEYCKKLLTQEVSVLSLVVLRE